MHTTIRPPSLPVEWRTWTMRRLVLRPEREEVTVGNAIDKPRKFSSRLNVSQFSYIVAQPCEIVMKRKGYGRESNR